MICSRCKAKIGEVVEEICEECVQTCARPPAARLPPPDPKLENPLQRDGFPSWVDYSGPKQLPRGLLERAERAIRPDVLGFVLVAIALAMVAGFLLGRCTT